MTKRQNKNQLKLTGIAVSSGIAIGKVRLIERTKAQITYQYLINDDQIKHNVRRFKDALSSTENQLITLKNHMPDIIKEHGFIMDSHLMILKDSMLTESTVNRILDKKICAEWALKQSLEEIRQIFNQIEDEYISSRINDVENVTERILWNLSGETQESLTNIKEPVIIAAHDLSPADTTEINVSKVIAFITDMGGRTSHAAIMAQSLQIPVVVGLESATKQLKDGDLLIVNGNTGEIIVNPDNNTLIYYQEKKKEQEEYKSTITKSSHLPAITLDGHQITVRANIEFKEEVVAVRNFAAEGIGLYRTEYLYLWNNKLPSEEELFEDYRKATETIAPAIINIRTLDLGADKVSSNLRMPKEKNPALGLRAIRFCLKEQQIFKNQLRAIIRASNYGNLQIIFPMISGIQEILDIKNIITQITEELTSKKIAFDSNIKYGIMIEVPSAVIMAEELAKHVDFFSIGTNDLIQYALAIDRENKNVAYMYQPFHPAILRMIHHVVKVAKNARIGVALCGEMCGDPLCVPILLGLGLKEFSMHAMAIPLIKKIIRSTSLEEASTDFDNILKLDTAKDVREYILNRMKRLLPELQEKGYLDH